MTENYILKQIPLFQQLNDVDLTRLASSLSELHLEKGETFFRKGARGDALCIIKRGRIKISLSSGAGDEVILAIFSETDFFGEMALLDGKPRSADATALEPVDLLLLSRQDFISFLSANSNAMLAVLESLSQRLRRTDDLLHDTCFLHVSGRFAKKLVELALAHGRRDGDVIRINLGLTQKDMASMVGATRESINKELRVLREKGLVTIEENVICIHNLERLKRRAH